MTTQKTGNARKAGHSGGTSTGTPRTIDLEASEVRSMPDLDAPEAAPTDASPEAAVDSPAIANDAGSGDNAEAVREDNPDRNNAANPSPAPQSRLVSAVIGGVFGGFASLLAAGGLNQIGVLQSVPLLSGLATQAPVTDPAAAQATAKLEQMETRLAAAEAKIAAPQDQATGSSTEMKILSTQLDDLFKRMGSVEKALADASAATPPSGIADTKANSANTVDSAKINMIANQMDDLFKRLKTAEDGLAQASSRQSANGTAVAEAAIESLKSEMVVLRQEIDAGIGETTSKLANETGALEARISELSGKLETVTAAASRKLDSEQVVARSVAATALRTAYDRGEPFAPLLASVETLLGSQPTIEALRSHAATGVMTNDRLKTEFADLADTVLASVAPKEEGMMARLMANAKSLVKVRPAGPMQGSEPEAVVSRIEADLQSGALTSALAEWENLPEPAKAASADWSKSLQSRIEADQLMVQLSTFLSDAGTQ